MIIMASLVFKKNAFDYLVACFCFGQNAYEKSPRNLHSFIQLAT